MIKKLCWKTIRCELVRFKSIYVYAWDEETVLLSLYNSYRCNIQKQLIYNNPQGNEFLERADMALTYGK